MKAYFIIFVVIFSIAFIAGAINYIAEKHRLKSFIANISSLIANGLGIVVVFMFFGGLLCKINDDFLNYFKQTSIGDLG